MEQDYISNPLQQVSPDRINQLRIPPSPSVPAYLNENAEPQPKRRDSELCVAADVRSKIAFLNNMSGSKNSSGNTLTNSFTIAASPTRSPIRSAFNSPTKSHSRANSTFSMPADQPETVTLIQTLQGQLEQSRNRERLVAERVESLMEQLTSAHARARHEKQAYEKEIKSLNKMQYRSELALIKCQEEIREARCEQEGFKMRAEHEKQAKEKSRREAFERARTLASNMEELEVVKRERDVLQTENEALKALQSSLSLTAQDELRSESRHVGVQVKFDTVLEVETVLGSKAGCTCSKNQQPTIEDFHPPESDEMQELQDELTWVKSQLKREQHLVHFMNMQCQFRACPCRQSEKAGVRFVHDHQYDERQRALAEAKGFKRKAEDELPMPEYVSLKKVFGLGKGNARAEPARYEHLLDGVAMTPQPEQEVYQAEQTEVQGEDDSTLRALSENVTLAENTTAGVLPLEEAVDIPLPSPRSDDLEPTSILEDMTQVMVEPEPAATSSHFAFSTSTSSRRPAELETPILRHSHSALSVSATDDLFDIAPPRHHLPPRPSTVMGIRTTDSPIRMVPPSPQQNRSLTPTTSPPRYRSVQVPLKGEISPLRHAITQRRSQSRHRERSRARSPTPGTSLPDSTSPSAATYFPVTPKSKTERQQRQIHIQSHFQLNQLQTQTSTTTTMVPLRGFEEDDDFSPEKHTQSYEHTHIQLSSTDSLSRGRQPLPESATNAGQSSIMLPGTPITREAALAQIQARRDRARSENVRKLNIADNDESGRVKTPRSVARRGVMLNREGRDISNLSQASAPARF